MKKFLLFLFILPLCTKAQIINTVAGNGTAGYSGDGGQATTAEINQPDAVSVDAFGNMYIADWGNSCIRKVNTLGIISTVAGTGVWGFSGDGGQATAAQLYQPGYVLADNTGTIYIADSWNNCIRKVSTSGIISTIAGICGTSGFGGDTGPATDALLNMPYGMALDGSGNLYVGDEYNNRVRKINTSGIITTLAGTGTPGYTGDDMPATATELYQPTYLCIDALSNLFISDNKNQRIRKVNALGIITTIAGTGVIGSLGDGGPATVAQLNWPGGLATDAAGNVYIADCENYKVRKVNASGTITSIAGTGVDGYSGDGGLATLAELGLIIDIALDAGGNLLIADHDHSNIRKIESCVNTISASPVNDTVVAGTSAIYSVATTMTSAAYQWQEDPGTGFVNLADVWPYSGVATNTLTIHNASLYLNATNYRCVITNGLSCADTSEEAILMIKSNTGVNSVNGYSEITVYPNPATNTLTISSTGLSIKQLTITDLVGQTVHTNEYNNGKVQVDLTSLPAGVYFVKINGTEVKKFIKE